MLGILTFMPQEARGFLRRLEGRRRTAARVARLHSGRFQGIPAVVAIAGTGPVNAARGYAALREAFPVKAIAVCGVAAALEPGLGVGDVLLADAVLVGGPAGRSLRPTPAPALSGAPAMRSGPLLTVDRVLGTAAEKRALAPVALAADMETASAAELAARDGLPWCAMRAISDAADEDLPIDLNRCLDEERSIRIPLVLREVLLHPATLSGMLRLASQTNAACKTLATAAAAYLPPWFRQIACG